MRLSDAVAGDFPPLSAGVDVLDLVFVDEGRLLLVHDATAAALLLLDGRTGQRQAAKLPAGRIQEVAARPGGAIVAVRYLGGTVSQWDVRTGKTVGEPMVQPRRCA